MNRYVPIGVMVLLVAVAGLYGWHRSRMKSLFVSTRAALKQVYETRDPNLAGHQQAEAALAIGDDILVLASANLRGASEQTWLLRLSPSGELRWQRHLEAHYGAGHALATFSDGGIVIVGDTRRRPTAYQGQLVHIADDGRVLADAPVGPQGIAGLSAIAALPNGSLLAGGMADGKGFLIRVDPKLQVTWEMPLTDVEEITSVTALAHGGIAAAANQEKPTSRLGIGRVLSLGRDDGVRWQRRVPAENRGELAAIAALSDGGIVVAGHSVASEGAKTRIFVSRLSEEGVPIWERQLGPADREQRGRAIVALPDGGAIVAGDMLDGAGRRAILVARLRADGTPLWERIFGGEGQDVARAISWLPNGSLVVVGSTMRKSSDHGLGKTNVLILHIADNGDLFWERIFGSAAPRAETHD